MPIEKKPAKKEAHFVLFLVVLILWNWPLVTIIDKGNPRVVFAYLFLSWAITIFLLYFISRSYKDRLAAKAPHPQQEPKTGDSSP